MTRKATQPRSVLPITTHPAPTAGPTLGRLLSPAGTVEDWTKHPTTWDGSGKHTVSLYVETPGMGESIDVRVALERYYTEPCPGRLHLDIRVQWDTLRDGTLSRAEQDMTFDLNADGVLALAEALRRLLPLAREHGLLPAENPA